MSYPVLYVPAGDVVPIMFTSYDENGASVTLTGLAVTDIEIYKDGSTTQRASDAGYTLLDTDGIDFDALTGIHGFSIDTGDNTDAGFYTVGAWFTVVVSAVTISSQTVSFIAAMFRLMAAESIAAKPKVDVDGWLGTAAATPTVAGVPEVDVTHFNGTAGTFASGRPEVNMSHIAGSAVSTTTAQVGVNVVQVSGDSVAADNAEAFFDGTGYAGTNNVIPSVTTVTGNVNGSVGSVTGAVGSVAAGGITASSIAADAIGASELAADAATEIADAVLSRQMTEGYASDTVAPTVAQMMYMIWSALSDFAISGTTITCRKIDGSTTSMTFTTDSSTSPTSRTRTT